MKEALAVLAVSLNFVGYIPYIRDTLKGKTHPHAYSWFVWTYITVIVFALQLSDGGGAGAYVTLGAVRHALGLLALSSYTFVTVLFPLTWAIANTLFSITLILRRRRIGHD